MKRLKQTEQSKRTHYTLQIFTDTSYSYTSVFMDNWVLVSLGLKKADFCFEQALRDSVGKVMRNFYEYSFWSRNNNQANP